MRAITYTVIFIVSLLLVSQAQAINLKKFIKDTVTDAVKEETKKEKPTPEKAQPASRTKSTKAVVSTKSRTHKAKAGFKVTLPPKWVVAQDEKKSFRADFAGETGVSVSVIANDYGKGFPVDASLKAYIDNAMKEKKDGKIDDCSELSLGKAKGIMRIEKAPSDSGDPRRITYQGYAGTVGINVVASCRGKTFEQNRSALEKIVRSLKF